MFLSFKKSTGSFLRSTFGLDLETDIFPRFWSFLSDFVFFTSVCGKCAFSGALT